MNQQVREALEEALQEELNNLPKDIERIMVLQITLSAMDIASELNWIGQVLNEPK